MNQPIATELIRFLGQRFPALPDALDADTSLVQSGAIDSLGILEITTFLSEEFEIEIDDDDFEPENFETVGSLVALVSRKVSA